jgi:hypothetical protein
MELTTPLGFAQKVILKGERTSRLDQAGSWGGRLSSTKNLI